MHFYTLLFLVGSGLLLGGCVHSRRSHENRLEDRHTIDSELSKEMSLKADREKLDNLRKDIPEEKQKSNDELALYLNLMNQGTEQPQMVRDRFTVLVEKKRMAFRQEVQRLRDDYRRDETKRRDEFLDKQKSERTEFLADKHSSKARSDFFTNQDRDRRSFFADERDRRANFESDIRARSKDFDSYMHERTNEFNEQYRLYSKRYSERPKPKNAVTGESSDFDHIDKVPTSPLGTEQ